MLKVHHLSDGRVLQAELVIGADGAQSWVRGQADIGIDYRLTINKGGVIECEKPSSRRRPSVVLEKEQGIIALAALPWNRLASMVGS